MPWKHDRKEPIPDQPNKVTWTYKLKQQLNIEPILLLFYIGLTNSIKLTIINT